MVLRAGLALAAVGLGGFFLIQAGVPPLYVGGALVVLVVLGAVMGPDTGSSGGSGGGGGGSGGSKTANAINAANGFLDALGNGNDGADREPSGPGREPDDDDSDTGTGPGPGGDTGDDIDIEINNYIRNINFVDIEQNITQIINDLNITREENTYINQFVAILMALDEGDYHREGDVIVISPGDIDITVQAETLINFLNILVSINYQELRQLIIKLLDMRDADSWEIRIEQLIIIYREGDGGGGSGGGKPDDRWELMAHIINNSRLNDQLKNELKSILVLNRGSGYDLPNSLTPRKVYAVRKRFAIPPNSAVEQITNDFIAFLQNQNIQRINDNTLGVIINQFIVNEIDISKQTVPNDINPRDVSKDIMGQEGKDIETILSDAKDEVKIAEEIKELNQNIVRDIENIEKIYEKNQKLFENIDQIKFTNFKEVSPQEMYSTIKKLDQYTTLDLATEQGAVTVANSVHEMHRQLNDLMNSLRQLDDDTSKLVDEERDVVSHAEDLEAHVEKLEKLADTMARFNGVDSADKLGNPGNM